jgi:hypothetical protein
MPCATLEAALDVVNIYKQRWSFVCFHRILKSGFGIEEARLLNRQRLENLTSVLSIISWHIFWLYQFGRKVPLMDASLIFDPVTIAVIKTSAKKLKIAVGNTLSMGHAVLIIALGRVLRPTRRRRTWNA